MNASPSKPRRLIGVVRSTTVIENKRVGTKHLLEANHRAAGDTVRPTPRAVQARCRTRRSVLAPSREVGQHTRTPDAHRSGRGMQNNIALQGATAIAHGFDRCRPNHEVSRSPNSRHLKYGRAPYEVQHEASTSCRWFAEAPVEYVQAHLRATHSPGRQIKWI